ncbi:MAG: type II toxin-antitoxin system prevent-host-death family antitoxin [Phycisphaerales bacterium]|nr:type II toxin-antitoxin system prevent-host-death family antitoxin [Phycisphaerales bacterium]
MIHRRDRKTSKRSPTRPVARWQLQDAKASFSKLFDQAITDGPQTVTRRNKQVVIVLSQADYGKLTHTGKTPSLVEALLAMPKVSGFKTLERDRHDMLPSDKTIFD